MKFRLAKAISLYEAYLQENSEVAEPSSTAVSARSSIIRDVDTIITSLETLATQIAEDLENEPNLTEAGEESTTKKVADYLIFAKKYKKMQQKINAMKISKADLEFAAKNLPAAEKAKKEVLNAKAQTLSSQINDLQDLVNDKAQERGQYVQKVLSKTKIEGQMELVKHTLGADPSDSAKKDLAQRMADLKQRYQKEVSAMKELEDQKPTPEKTKDAEKAAQDQPAAKKEETKADDKVAKTEADIKAYDKNISDESATLRDLEKKLKELEDEKSKSTNPDSFDQKILKAKEDIRKSKEDIKEMQAEKAKLVKQSRSNESAEINEGNWSKMMSGVKKYSESGPWAIVAIEGNKVIGQEVDIKTKEMIPAHYESMKKEYPKAKLHIEDATGTVVWNESAAVETELNESINKNALLNRAEALGLTSLAEEISKKEEWQLNKTALYSKFDTEIKKAEYNTTLQADKYTALSVKDKFSKLM